MFPSLQTAILAATQPDAMVLVVNAYDPDDYIIRTIRFAESVTNSKVSCIALSFRNIKASFSPLEQNIIYLSENEIIEHTQRISALTGISCFSINQVNEIFKNVVNYLN